MANDISQKGPPTKWVLGWLQIERFNLTNDFASSEDERQSSRVALNIAELSLRIQRIEQHLEDFQSLKHHKNSQEVF